MKNVTTNQTVTETQDFQPHKTVLDRHLDDSVNQMDMVKNVVEEVFKSVILGSSATNEEGMTSDTLISVQSIHINICQPGKTLNGKSSVFVRAKLKGEVIVHSSK